MRQPLKMLCFCWLAKTSHALASLQNTTLSRKQCMQTFVRTVFGFLTVSFSYPLKTIVLALHRLLVNQQLLFSFINHRLSLGNAFMERDFFVNLQLI